MNNSSEIISKKPRIIPALLSGFNTIANKPYLIIFPIILDLFLWFGPAWRVADYFRPAIQSLTRLPGLETAESAEILQEIQTIWQGIIANFNLAISIRTFPIGVPSLMVSKQPFLNPIGQPVIFNLNSSLQVMGIWVLFLLIGFFLGSLYFQNISWQIIVPADNAKLKSTFRSFIQIIAMPFLLLLILLIIIIPVLLLIGLVSIISPSIGQFILLVAGIVTLWIIMPLVFTPHGIFLYRQNLISAMMTSINVVRFSMSNTAWFILMSFVLIEGLDFLWRSPTVDNWFLMVGIFGHAFVVTAVIAASFHYFIDATKFTQAIMNHQIKLKSNPQ